MRHSRDTVFVPAWCLAGLHLVQLTSTLAH